MKPHPRIRKTVKWGGAALGAALLGAWIVAQWHGYMVFDRGGTGWGIQGGAVCRVDVSRSDVRGMGTVRYRNEPTLASVFQGAFRFHANSPMGARADCLPMWIPAFCAFGCAGLAQLCERRAARRTFGLCPKCNYDRTGLAAGAVCPECGGLPRLLPLPDRAARASCA